MVMKPVQINAVSRYDGRGPSRQGCPHVDLKDAGDPVENTARYQQKGADELALVDKILESLC